MTAKSNINKAELSSSFVGKEWDVEMLDGIAVVFEVEGVENFEKLK